MTDEVDTTGHVRDESFQSGLSKMFDRMAKNPSGDPRFHALLREIGELHDRQQADYGAEGDPFSNVRGSSEWGVLPWVGALVRANDKVRRLQAFARRGTLRNESARDSMLDLAVYALIALILYEEEKNVEEAEDWAERISLGARDVEDDVPSFLKEEGSREKEGPEEDPEVLRSVALEDPSLSDVAEQLAKASGMSVEKAEGILVNALNAFSGPADMDWADRGASPFLREEVRVTGRKAGKTSWAVRQLIVEALVTDGGHHKQWYLEEIAKALQIDLDEDHEPGIAP